MRFAASALAVLALASAAQAQFVELDRDALYVSEREACHALETQGQAGAFSAIDFTAFSFSRGLEAPGFQCGIVQIHERPDAPMYYASVLCDTPVLIYPDQLAIYPVSDTAIEIYSTYEATMVHSGVYGWDSSRPVGVTLYHRCENLSELPVD